jgi:GLPGLI family protein
MKKIFTLLLATGTIIAYAQPKIINQAIITTTTNIVAPEDEDVAQIQPQDGGGRGGGFNFRAMMEGEIKTTTYLKNELVKTSVRSETIKVDVYRNNTTKTTTTINEMMGNTTGMVSNDDEDAMQKKKMDSMFAERAKTDTNMRRRTRNVQANVTVENTSESKKIAGYNCKKAYLISDRIIRKDTLIIWYTPEIKFENFASTGGMSGLPMMRMMGGGAANFDKVDGFVMQYDMKVFRGRTMEVRVTKIDTGKEVAAKEFEIPKGVELKSTKDVNAQMGSFRIQER